MKSTTYCISLTDFKLPPFIDESMNRLCLLVRLQQAAQHLSVVSYSLQPSFFIRAWVDDVYSVWNEEAVAITVSINDRSICTEWKFLQILGIK